VTSTHTPGLEVELPDAPRIPGLRFRHFRDESDWVGLAALHKAVSLADDDDEIPTPESLRISTESLPGFSVPRDLLIVEVDGEIVGDATSGSSIRDGYAVHYIHGNVHPDWRRRRIGRAVLHWNVQRARDVAAADPSLAGPGAQLGVWASDNEHGAIALLESEGFTIQRYGFSMIHRHLDRVAELPLPGGLEIRPVTEEHHRAIFDADDEAFHDHFEHRPQTEADFTAQFAQPDLDTSLWRVAWAGNQVAGSVQAWIWKEENEVLGVKRTWLERISVRRPWRRMGLARALIASALVGVRERGITEALLGVDAQNPNGALALYESIGFETKVRARSYRKPLDS
jgi:ribosomal protein S18 acetylase RimI-like enzyme